MYGGREGDSQGLICDRRERKHDRGRAIFCKARADCSNSSKLEMEIDVFMLLLATSSRYWERQVEIETSLSHVLS